MDVVGPANPQAVCATHQLMANGVCARCGGFICPRCSSGSSAEARCPPCAALAVVKLAHHPLISIWLEPRKLMRWVLEVRRTWMPDVLLLVVVTGIASRVQWLSIQSRGFAGFAQVRGSALAANAVATGIIYGLVNVFVLGWMVFMLGRLFGGTGDRRSVHLAMAWGALPTVWLAPLWFVAFGLTVPGFVVLRTLMLTGLVALSVWSFFIEVKCVAEAHRQSLWGAMGACFLANAVCCGGPIALFVGFYELFNYSRAAG